MSFFRIKPTTTWFAGLLLIGIAWPADGLAQGTVNWTMFRHNPAHTGRSPLAGPLSPDLAWQYNTAGFTYSSPSIAGDRMFIASQNELTALDLDGQELWSFEFPGAPSPPAIDIEGFVSTPAIAANGRVYIGSLDNHLYAVNADGSLAWSFDTGDQVFSSPLVGPDGVVYVGSRSKNVYAINPNGTLKWSGQTSGEILSSPALGPDGTLYVGSTDERLYAYDSNTGAFKWQPFQAQGEIVSSPAVGNDGNVYFGTIANRVYAVNSATGLASWPSPFQTSAEVISSPAISVTGTVYIGSFDGNLYAINGPNGSQKWATPFSAGEAIAASPSIDANGYVYAASLDGTLYVLFDGGNQPVTLWEFPTGAPIWASPAIGAENRVYVAASGSRTTPGRLFAIGQATYRVAFLSQPIAGEEATVSVLLTGTSAPASGTFFYRSAGSTPFTSLPFNGSVAIPSTEVTGRGLEYYIVGGEGTFPANDPQNRPAAQTVFVSQDTAPLPFSPRTYRMVSVPYTLSDPSLDAVLTDDYEAYGPLAWRLLRWNGAGYVEFPDIQHAFTPGNAFFLVTAGGDPFNVESAQSVDTSRPFPVLLNPGWNQVGNPFGFSVPWNRVVRNPNVVSAIAFFDGVEMIQDPESIAALDPWEGYFVFNESDADVSIQIPPVPAVEEIIEEPAGKSSGGSARLRITASIPDAGLSDSQNWIGFDERAHEGIDALDVREAPPFGEHVRLSIREGDSPFALSYKPPAAGGQSWNLEVTSTLPTKDRELVFSFERSTAFPADMHLVLIDDDYGFARRIDEESVVVTWDGKRPTRRFRLAAGDAAAIDDILGDLPTAPEQAAMDGNYPNPFGDRTRIGYRLDRRGAVNLTVYNALGQAVRVLIDDLQNPGVYEAAWDGHDSAGRPAGSGVYFYRLQAGSFSATGAMTLVR